MTGAHSGLCDVSNRAHRDRSTYHSEGGFALLFAFRFHRLGLYAVCMCLVVGAEVRWKSSQCIAAQNENLRRSSAMHNSNFRPRGICVRRIMPVLFEHDTLDGLLSQPATSLNVWISVHSRHHDLTRKPANAPAKSVATLTCPRWTSERTGYLCCETNPVTFGVHYPGQS